MPHAFVDHTIESAPPAARRAMTATERSLGYLPIGTRRMAESPELLDAFGKLTALFDATTLPPLAREVVVMTVATRHGCHLCVAMHSARLHAMGAGDSLIRALRDRRSLADGSLEAIRVFTIAVMDNAGDIDEQALRSLASHGYTNRNALEVVLGVGAYTLSTFANRMTAAPVDERLTAFA